MATLVTNPVTGQTRTIVHDSDLEAAGFDRDGQPVMCDGVWIGARLTRGWQDPEAAYAAGDDDDDDE